MISIKIPYRYSEDKQTFAFSGTSIIHLYFFLVLLFFNTTSKKTIATFIATTHNAKIHII